MKQTFKTYFIFCLCLFRIFTQASIPYFPPSRLQQIMTIVDPYSKVHPTKPAEKEKKKKQVSLLLRPTCLGQVLLHVFIALGNDPF